MLGLLKLGLSSLLYPLHTSCLHARMHAIAPATAPCDRTAALL
jgi:hypothetical protein